MRPETPSSSRRQRFSFEEAHEALLSTGVRLLVERGVGPGLSRVSLNDVIIDSGVPRASAYRVFGTGDLDPQVNFRLALLTRLIDESGGADRRDLTLAAILDALPPTDAMTPIELATTLREIVRVATGTLLRLALGNGAHRAIEANCAATALDPSPEPEILGAHQHARSREVAHFIHAYSAVGGTFGLRLRSGVSWDTFAAMVGATTGSAMLEWQLSPRTRATIRPTGPDGALREWSLNGLLVEGVILACFEADPAAAVSADLTSWIASVSASPHSAEEPSP